MLPRIVLGLAENTNSIFCDGPRARYSEWMSGSATAGTIAERHMCELVVPRHRYCALLKKRASRDVCFLLTNDLHGRRPLRRKVHLDYSLLHINWLFDAPSAGCGSGAQWAAIVVVGHPEKAVAKVT